MGGGGEAGGAFLKALTVLLVDRSSFDFLKKKKNKTKQTKSIDAGRARNVVGQLKQQL